MDKVKVIHLLEKYKSISQILGLQEDAELLDELMNMLDKYDNGIEKEKVTNVSVSYQPVNRYFANAQLD